MQPPLSIKLALALYDLLLGAAVPLLRFNHYLKEGFAQRCLKEHSLPAADIWIQAASVGEVQLAQEIIKALRPAKPLVVLITTNIKEALEILRKERKEFRGTADNRLTIHATYFPFDRPSLMTRAVAAVNPSLMVLLETELWPGLLSVCKKRQIKVALLNGRLKAKSLKKYERWQSLWRYLRPDRILAVSEADATRFVALFGSQGVDRMTNIKFDRMVRPDTSSQANALAGLVSDPSRFVVIGSARKQEEEVLVKALKRLLREDSSLAIGLFPRHLKRIKHWQEKLTTAGLSWQLRSQVSAPCKSGIILWDTYGELTKAYELARTAFVGGSLAPLGGQNLLEPLYSGVVPITGPDWSDFAWLGEEISSAGLLIEVKDWQDLCVKIVQQLQQPFDRQTIRARVQEYIRNQQGGADKAAQVIIELLANDVPQAPLP